MVPGLFRPPRSMLAAAVFALLGMAVPGAARADFVSPITFDGGNPSASQVLTVNFNNQNLTGITGQYLMHDANGTKFNAFCVDLSHAIPSTPYSVVTTTIPSFVPAPVGNQMAFLVNSYVNSPGTAAQAYLASKGLSATTQQAEAAVQLAIWKLEYGSNFNYDPSNSQNSSGPSTADMNAFMSQASGDTTSVATVLESTPSTDPNSPQGQSVATTTPPVGAPPVPEPSSVVLLGMGLAGFGAFRRRGRVSAKC